MFNQAPAPEILLEQCRRGDLRACRQLYEQYAGAMFNICLRMLNDTRDAEDMLQEAFSQVFKSLGTYRGEASIGAWIKRIVINKCLNHLKKKKMSFEKVAQLQIKEEEKTDEAAYALTVAKVQEAIQRLPDGYRVVLTLYLFEDYSHKEIAQSLGISESTAKTQYMRARAKVKQMVKEQIDINSVL